MNYSPSQSVNNVTGGVVRYKTIVELQNACVYFVSIGIFKLTKVENRKIEVC